MPAATASVHALHARFLPLVPEIERRAATAARRVRCPHRHADFVQEIIAASWAQFVAAIDRGECAVAAADLTDRAVADVRRNRQAADESARDVMSAWTQRKHGFTVTAIAAGVVAAPR